MAARFSFAVAEAQKKVDEGAFFDKQGIGDYMAILASGLKEGLQEKERQDLIKEKERKAEDAKLREKQLAAEKLTKDIDASAKLLLKVNGLAQNTALLPEIINIMTAQGSTNTSAAQAYIDNIDNIADFQSGYDMNMTLTEGQSPVTPKIKMINKNTSDVGDMNLAEVAHALNTPNLNVERKNALNERLAFLQTQGSEKTDSYWVNQITPQNIDILLPEFRDRQDEMIGGQWERVHKKINALRKLPEYQDKSDDLPYKNTDGSYKGDTELRQMLNDKNLKLSANERADILAILAPIDFEKPVTALGPNGVILERSKLLDQQKSEQLDEAQTSRLKLLEAAYQSFIAAGKIKEKEVYDPVKEAVDINEAGKTSETLLLFEDRLKDGLLDASDQQLYKALKLLSNNPIGKFSKLDKMIFRDYSNNSNDRVKLRDTIELLDEQIENYVEGKSSLSDEKFLDYKSSLLQLKAIEDAFVNDDKAKANELPFDLTNDYAEIKIVGDKNPTQVRLTKKGNFFIESGSRAGQVIARSSKDYEQGSLTPTTSQVEANSKLINRNDSFSTELMDLQNDTAKLTQTTVRLLNHVNENEAVLTIGGFAASADRIITGISQTLQLMNSSGTINEAKIVEDGLRVGMAEFEEANKGKANYQQLASIYEQFLSLSLNHAFQYAKLALGSSGQALSNFDFKNSLQINNAGVDFETYATNILNNASTLITQASNKYDMRLDQDLEHVASMKNKLYRETFEESGIAKGNVTKFLQESYPQEYAVVNAWMTDKTLPARINNTSVSQTSTGNTTTQPVVTLQQAQSILNNSDTEVYTEFMNDATKVGNREKAYNALAKSVYKTTNPTAEQLSHIKQYMEGLIVSNPSNNSPS